jgi:hypothetical protein
MDKPQKITTTLDQRLADQVDELKELQTQQMAAHDGDQDAIKKIKANRDPKLEVKDYEADYVHILLTQRINNEATKEYIEETKTIKLHPNQVDQMIATGIFNGYDDARVIHDPRAGKVKEFRLKSEPVAQVQPTPIVDASVTAAREQKIADREKAIEAQLAEMRELAAQIKGKSSQAPAETLPDFDEDAQQERTAPPRSHKKK